MWNWIQQAELLRSQGQRFVLATVTRITGSTPRETGAKLIVLPTGQFFGTVGGGNFESLVIADAIRMMDAKKECALHEPRLSKGAQVMKYPLGAKTGQCCGGVMEVLLEPINTGPHLYLFGAGHVGQAVCKSLSGSIFTVHAIDERSEWIESPEIPHDIIRHPTECTDFIESAEWTFDHTYAVVMTHRHDLDQDIIQKIIQLPAKYIGLIGSKSKWERFKQRLTLRGESEASLARVTSPIGLPIGGKAPQEIAISLAAELIQLHYQKNSLVV